MSTKLRQTGIVLGDGNIQTTKMDYSLDKGKLISVLTYTSNATWTKPEGCNKVLVIVQGGGGGGCGHCESGGAGGYAEKLVDVSSPSVTTVAVTVGGAGGGTGYHSGAGDGGTSSFGSYVSATGGRGANRDWGHTGGHGGHGSGGDVNLWGGGGRSHGDQGQAKGGGSFFGGAQVSGHHGGNYYTHYSENLNHNPPGTGGGGEWTSHSRGGNATSGVVIVYSYK